MTLFELLSQTNLKGIPEKLVLKMIDINKISESDISEIENVWNQANSKIDTEKDQKSKAFSEAIVAFTKGNVTEKQIADGKDFDGNSVIIQTLHGPMLVSL